MFKHLPIEFPDQRDIVAQEGLSYLYPQSFTIDWEADEIFILYGPAGGSTKRWIAVYGLETVEYKSCFHAGDSGGEGIVIKYEGGSRYLYVKTDGDKLGRFTLSQLPTNKSSITPRNEYDVNLSTQFAYRDGVWIVEDNTPSLGYYRRRNNYSYYDENFNKIGQVQVPVSEGGLPNSPYEDYIPKRQNIGIMDGNLVSISGGYYEKGTKVKPYHYQGIKLLNSNGNLIADGMIEPSGMISTLEDSGYICNRVEHEGLHVCPNGDVYTLLVHRTRVPSHQDKGIIIFKEMDDAENHLDFSKYGKTYPNIDFSKLENGTYPRSKDGKMFNVVTGEELDTLEKILTFMAGVDLRNFSFYSSSVSVRDINGALIPSSKYVTITNSNNLTFFVEYFSLDGSNRYVVYGDPGNRTQAENDDFSDTRWIDLNLLNGVELFGPTTRLQCRRIGRTIHLRGALKNISGNTVVASLPQRFRPIGVSQQIVCPTSTVGGNLRFARWEIHVNGDITMVGSSDGNYSNTHWFPIFTSYPV